MSVSYHLICEDCKKSLWIGQSYRAFYSGEPHTMEALREFLFDHIDHHLTFGAPEHRDEMLDGSWEKIDADKYKK